MPDEEKEKIYPKSAIHGAEGAMSGAVAGGILSSGILPGRPLPFNSKSLGSRGLTTALGALSGAGTGFAVGGGVGALMDYYDIKKAEALAERKALLRHRMEEMRMERAAYGIDFTSGLSKTAGFIDGIKKLTGKDYRSALKEHGALNTMDGFSSMSPTEYFPKLEEASANVAAEKKLRDEARRKAGLAGTTTGIVGGLGGLSVYENQRINDQILKELAAGHSAGTNGIEGHQRQGAGSVSSAPAGEDKTASLFALRNALEKNAASDYPDFQSAYETNEGIRRGVSNDQRVIAGDHIPYTMGTAALPGLGAGMIGASTGLFGKSKVGKGLGVAGSTALGAGLGYGWGKTIQGGIEGLNEATVGQLSGKDHLTNQEQFFLDRSKKVLEKEASVTPLFNPLEKTAGPLNFIKNFTGKNVTKAQNRLNEIKAVPTNMQKRYEYTQEASKNLNNAKADRNRARLGGGLALGTAGAGLGGYNAFKKSQEPGVDEPMNQLFANQQQKQANESIISRLEKTAGIGQNISQHAGDAMAAIRAGGADALVSARNLGQNALDSAKSFPAVVSGSDYRNMKNVAQNVPGGMPQEEIDAVRNQMLMAQGLAGAGALGAGGAGYALANRGDEDEEQVAYEDLMDRLEKTAAPDFRQMGRNMSESFGNAKYNAQMMGRDLTGANARATAQNQQRLWENPEASNLSVADFQNRHDALKGANEAAVLRHQNAKRNAALIGGTGAAVGAGGTAYGLSQGDGEEQTAMEELMSRLDKTAAPGAGLFNKAKNAVGNAKYKAQMGARDFSGANTKSTAQNMQKMWDDPKNHNLSVSEFQQKYDKLKGANQAAISRQSKARKNTSVAAGGLAAGGTGTAGVAALNKKDDDNEKQATDVLNGLYKEAASAIIDESIPPVKKHVDPMSRITFSR